MNIRSNMVGLLLMASLGSLLIPTRAWAGPALEAAFAAADLDLAEPLPLKVEKVLRLLNDQGYLGKTPEPGTLPPPLDQPYNFDSMRVPEEIFSEKRGGYCNSKALAAAALFIRAGIPDRDVRIVEAINDDDLAVICPQQGLPRMDNPQTGASGHVFVAIKWTNGRWRLINTVNTAESYAWAPWPAPGRIAALMRSKPVAIPSRAMHKGPNKPMTVIQSWRLGAAPRNNFDQHLDIAASGIIGNATCRYGAR